jgi:hypothetical protein
MKLYTALFLGALLTIPGIALAQTASPMPPCAPPADATTQKPDMSKMRAMMKQTETLHKAERTSMLAALSPAHRAYLASVVGQLAIAANPDPKAAAAQIDAKLSTSERSAILAAQKSFEARMMAAHTLMFAGMMPRQETGDEAAESTHHHHTVTAGMLLLAQTGFGPMMGHGRMMPMGPGMMQHHRGPGGPMGSPEPMPTPTP